MKASLGMYVRAETLAATDRFWGGIRDQMRARGLNAPDALDHVDPFWAVWQDPDFVFSQTCGRPYRLKLHDNVGLIATPNYGLADCAPGYYRSLFVVRSDDTRQNLRDFENAVFAYNEELSQSGWAAPLCHVAKMGFGFSNIWQSGGHEMSAKAVAEGRADIAALDGMSWHLIKEFADFAADLRVLAATDQTPGLPYVTNLKLDTDVMFDVVKTAIDGLDPADRDLLCLRGLVRIPASDYLAVANP